MDLATLIPIVSPLVAAAVAYLRDEAAGKAGEKAAEVIGEKAGEALVGTGSRVLSLFRDRFHTKSDGKALSALEAVKSDPNNKDYQDILVEEAARLAQSDATFAQDMKILAQEVTVAQQGGIVINNSASNEGAQGIFNAPVTFNKGRSSDE